MATNPKESSKARQPIGIAGGILLLSTIGMLLSQDLSLLLPRRGLSSPSTETYHINRTTTATPVQPSFMKTIPCGLPIPALHHPSTTSNDNDTVCTLFFPERFFASVGKKYQQQYETSKEVETEHPAVHMTLQTNNTSSAPKLPTTMTYLHIRKCGGTTMFQSLKNKNLKLPYHVDKYNRDRISDLGVLQDIYHRQQQQNQLGHDDAVVFSFVRDPVIRFLSSVGQIRHLGRRKLVVVFPKCKDTLMEEGPPDRYNDNMTIVARSQALVRCVLDSLQSSAANTAEPITTDNANNTTLVESYNYMDQHLLPQAYELRAHAHELDISVRLMSMTERMGPTLATLLGESGHDRHARSSRGTEYTHGYLLEPEILTKQMILDICRIYAVDVLLLQTTRVAPTLCDKIVDTY